MAYAVYVMFFPQLVAGPIERPAQLLPQLRTVQTFDYARVVSGAYIMFRGFFKKLVIADNLAIAVDFIYGHLGASDSSVVLFAVIAFPLQLYADFSGYSDIAVGSSRMFGVELVQNFKQPFFSRSIAELWRRWHISLSTWFRDYVYFPVSWKGRHYGRPWEYLAVLLTFMLTGVWHGAGWKFCIMGLLFGLYICAGTATKAIREKVVAFIGLNRVPLLHSGIQWALTFALASYAWVYFRALSATQAFEVTTGLFTHWSGAAFQYLRCSSYCSAYQIGISRKELIVIVVSIVWMFVWEYVEYKSIVLPSRLRRRWVRWSYYYALIFWLLLFASFAPKTFIYFQF